MQSHLGLSSLSLCVRVCVCTCAFVCVRVRVPRNESKQSVAIVPSTCSRFCASTHMQTAVIHFDD